MNLQGREVQLERPGKLLFPQAGVTKADLANYLLQVSGRMLPHLRDRPMTFVRMPDGVGGPVFFQKNTPAHIPRWIPRCISTGSGDAVDYTLVNEAPALVVLADQAVGEFHGWVATCSDPTRPDRLVVDFDPPEPELFDVVRQGALDLAALLQKRGGTPFVMRTGSRGLHLVVPLVPEATHREVNAFVDAVARSMVRHQPERFTMEARKAKRGGKVYLDTLRNRRNQTSVVPWSPRIRETASIAAPLSLEELDDDTLDSMQVTIPDAQEWLERPDPWAGFFEAAVPLRRML